jgi:tRNA threonylcarbamoyladenosine biosynthesis protein TsaE
MRTLHVRSSSAAHTAALGRALGGLLEEGDVVSLSGDLGAGKTTFVQGAAAALSVTEPVLSPTFTLVRTYAGRIPVHHVDVYRLRAIQDVLDLGWDELLEGGGVVLVEWGDVIESLLPEDHLDVQLTIPGGEPDVRLVAVRASGRKWEEAWPAVARAVDASAG